MWKSIHLLLFWAFVSSFPASESKTLEDGEFSSSSTSLELKYGEDCSWEAEVRRRDYLKLLFTGNLTAIKQSENEFIENGYKLCSASKLNVCDEESQKCVCGDPGYELINKVDRSLYILEGRQQCRWNTNTYCVSSADRKCKLGTTCRTTAGEVCSDRKMTRYLLKNYELELMTSPERLLKVMSSGKICSCKEDEMVNEANSQWDDSEDDNGIQGSGKLKRWRRSALSGQGHFDNLESIAGPIVSI